MCGHLAPNITSTHRILLSHQPGRTLSSRCPPNQVLEPHHFSSPTALSSSHTSSPITHMHTYTHTYPHTHAPTEQNSQPAHLSYYSFLQMSCFLNYTVSLWDSSYGGPTAESGASGLTKHKRQRAEPKLSGGS